MSQISAHYIGLIDCSSMSNNLNQTAKAVPFFAKETQKTEPARRRLGWRYTVIWLMWLKKEISSNHESLGNITSDDNEWNIDISIQGLGVLNFYFSKSGDKPEEAILNAILSLKCCIAQKNQIAQDYILSQKVDEFTSGEAIFCLSGVFFNNHKNYDFEFTIPAWDDGLIIVHFIDGNVRNLSLVD